MRKTTLFLIIGLLVSMGISQSDKSASFKSKVPPQKQETVNWRRIYHQKSRWYLQYCNLYDEFITGCRLPDGF